MDLQGDDLALYNTLKDKYTSGSVPVSIGPGCQHPAQFKPGLG
jgi:hypothetical protein